MKSVCMKRALFFCVKEIFEILLTNVSIGVIMAMYKIFERRRIQ